MIGFPNRIDAATLSSGAWTAGLPQANLKNRIIGKVARTVDATNASTKLDVDLGAAKNTRIISLVNHNISLSGRYRLRGGADNTFAVTLVDTGWVDVWPVVYPFEVLDWEADNWWTGKYTAEETAGYTTALTIILSGPVVAQYWRLEIDDTTNVAGYVQAGRIFLGPAWQPIINMSYGSTSIGWETKTEVQEALGGAEYFQMRTPYRVARFSLDWLTENEGMANAFEIDRRAGIDQEVFWVHDTADTVHALRRRFIGRIRTLSPIEFPYQNINKKPYEIKELK